MMASSTKMAALGCLALAVVLTGCAPRPAAPPPEGRVPPQSYVAPDFTVPALAGAADKLSLSSLVGQVVLLEFWATWCPACRWELPRLDRLYADLKDKGFALVGLSVDEGSVPEVAESVKPFGLSFPVALAGPEVQAAYGGIRALPTKFLLDRKGGIRKAYKGVVPPEELRADIEALLAQ